MEGNWLLRGITGRAVRTNLAVSIKYIPGE
jgi:hypothetical protein